MAAAHLNHVEKARSDAGLFHGAKLDFNQRDKREFGTT
jgi:hypothetical protein